MESSNPALKNLNRTLTSRQAPNAAHLQQMYDQPSYTPPTGYGPGYADASAQRPITMDDVVAKTATILGVAIIVGAITAYFQATSPALAQLSFGLVIPALIVGLILSLIIIFKRSTNPALILSYAAVEGVLLGAITGAFNVIYPGIALQAVVGTLGVFIGMIFVYKSGRIRVTPRFTKMVVGALVGVVALMVLNMLGSWLFDFNLGLRDGSPMAIIFSLVCIGIAAMSFMLDFDQIDKAVAAGVEQRYAWYFAFGLMVTLVWLYLEILRLLSYLRD